VPFTHTRASKSTASKCRSIRRAILSSSHGAGTSNVRRYHMRSARSITPDSADSTGNGTMIDRLNGRPIGGSSSAPSAISNCHTPFRFIHAARAICGRGYARWMFPGFTSSAQRVMSGAGCGCHGACARPEWAPSSARSAVMSVMQFVMSPYPFRNGRQRAHDAGR